MKKTIWWLIGVAIAVGLFVPVPWLHGSSIGGAAYSLIENAGTPLTQQSILNFTGAGISCANDGSNHRTTCTVSGSSATFGGVNVQTGNYTLQASDSGLLVVMNCSGACAAKMYGTPSSTFSSAVVSIGSTLATINLNSLDYNGTASAPLLTTGQILYFGSDGTNYFGNEPFTASTNVTFTPGSNNVAVSASGGSSGLSILSPYIYDGTNCWLGPAIREATIPIQANFSWTHQSTAGEAPDGTTCVGLVLSDSGHSGTTSVSLRKQAISSFTTLFTVTSCNVQINVANGKCGVAYYESASDSLVGITWGNDGVPNPSLEIQYCKTVTNGCATTFTEIDDFQTKAFTSVYALGLLSIEMVYNGTTITFSLCGALPTGNCEQFYSEAKAAHFTTAPDNWGYWISAQTSNVANELFSWKAQ